MARAEEGTGGEEGFLVFINFCRFSGVPSPLFASSDRAVLHGCVGSGWAGRPRGASGKEASRGFEPRSLDSESRVLTITPRGHCSF